MRTHAKKFLNKSSAAEKTKSSVDKIIVIINVIINGIICFIDQTQSSICITFCYTTIDSVQHIAKGKKWAWDMFYMF